MSSRSALVLNAVLLLLKPLVRHMLRHGVAYPVFAGKLKQVFLEAARDELKADGKALTDSAVSLLSGVHRRDIRTLGRATSAGLPAAEKPMNMATQVVARWLTDAQYLDANGQPCDLPRDTPGQPDAPSFDSLVTRISSDIRPRAVLDELVRLGIAEEVQSASGTSVHLLAPGFAPRQGFAEMTQLLRDNLHDHLAASTQNLDSNRNFLEQSIFVDEITAESAHQLHTVSARAWRQAFKTVMQEAAARHAHDEQHASPDQRTHRARFGSFFYSEETPHDAPPS